MFISKKKYSLTSLISIGVAFALTGISPDVMAQSAEASLSVEEILVTARRRTESLQDAPLAVTAISGAELEATGAFDITNLQQSVPNATIEVARGSNSTLIAFIRGVGQQDPLWGFEPGVGLYVDDVYIARPQGAVLDIFDVERIEVLRGPQGTLYGRNTIGGAIRYVSKRLGDEAKFDAKLNVGTFNQRDVILSGAVPVSNTLAFGAALAKYDRDGFGTNVTTGAEHYDKDVLAYRLSAEWTPSENVFVRASFDGVNDDSNAKHGHREIPGVINAEPVLANVFDTRAGLGDTNTVETLGASLQAEWNINDTTTLKSITAYREGETITPIDFDGLAGNDFDVPAFYSDHQFTQEFQVLFDKNQWSGVAGVYLLDGNADGAFDVVLGNLFGGFTVYTFGDVDTDSIAGFADVTYEYSDQLNFSFGGRYTEDTKDAVVLRQNYLGLGSPTFGGSAVPFGAPRSDVSTTRKDDKFSPRVSVDYKPSDDATLYASYSQGFKGGGVDPRGDSSVSPLVALGFGPEIVDSYEAGYKRSFMDGRFNLNTAVFYADYSDQQITTQTACDLDPNIPGNDSFCSGVFNAGESEYKGLEMEAQYRASENLSFSGMLGLIDAEITKVDSAGVNIADQFVVQNTPETTAKLGFMYLNELAGNNGEIAFSGNIAYRSDYHLFNTELSGFAPTATLTSGGPALDPESVTLLNASAVWTSGSGQWSLGLHGKNLTDEEYKVAAYNFASPSQLGTDASYTAFYGQPRTITATVGFHY